MPKCLVFFRQTKHINWAYEWLVAELNQRSLEITEKQVEMYHLSTDDPVKKQIVAEFMVPHSMLRVVLCSTSFSMGINLRNVRLVVHYGAANDIDSYIQETGRAGRSPDEDSHAVVLLYKHCLSSKNISSNMKTYIRSTECRRKLLLADYMDGREVASPQPSHKCCDLCANTCTCGDCPSPICPVYVTYEATTESDKSDSDIELYRRKPVLVLSESDSDA